MVSSAAATVTYLTAGGSVSGWCWHVWNESIIVEFSTDVAESAWTTRSSAFWLSSPKAACKVAIYKEHVSLLRSHRDEHRDVAVEATQSCLATSQDVNGAPVLPFNAKRIKTLAVVGPNGDQPRGDYAAGSSWGGDRCGGGPVATPEPRQCRRD